MVGSIESPNCLGDYMIPTTYYHTQNNPTGDGRNVANQLIWTKNKKTPTIYIGFITSKRWLFGISEPWTVWKTKTTPTKTQLTTGQNIQRSAILERHANRGYFPFPKSENPGSLLSSPFFFPNKKCQMSHSPCSWQLVVNSHSSMPRPKGFRGKVTGDDNQKSAFLYLKQRFSCSYSSFMLLFWFYSLVCCCGCCRSCRGGCCCCCCRSCAALVVLLWLCCSGCVVPVVLLFFFCWIIQLTKREQVPSWLFRHCLIYLSRTSKYILYNLFMYPCAH